MNNTAKIKTLDELSAITADLRGKGRRIVHCHGVFDLLHIGHIRYLEQARTFGDVLVVTVTPDRYVDKGPHRPAFSEQYRVEAVASLHAVDYAAVNEWPTAEETLRALRPHVYVKGSDFKSAGDDRTGKLALEREAAEEVGAELRFTRDIVFSSSNLINRFLSSFPEDIQQYLSVFRSRRSLGEINALFDRMAELDVLVAGDTILDDYHYCKAIGSSSKDPVLALKFQSNDLFAGGVLAVANHIANFARTVKLVTVIGEHDSHEEFIRSKLRKNVEPVFFVQNDAPTIVKRRFVEGYTLNKLLEIYMMDDSGLDPATDGKMCGWIRDAAGDCDLAVIADFGHGAVSDGCRSVLIDAAPFLAINVQANAGNRGFNTVTKYRRADYVSIAEHEVRLEMRDERGNLRDMIDRLGRSLDAENFVVTRGSKGSLVRSRDGSAVEVPAFAQKVLDRIGAGDAFLSVTSLAAKLGAPPEILGFIGNVVGALAVGIVGNQKSIERASVEKFITSLMK